jgi:L-histidine Nalpha-methyltransferase
MDRPLRSQYAMASLASITIHSSQFPGQVRRDLVDSLRLRQISPKFHYDSIKQSQKWLALHRAFSPAWVDPAGRAVYDRAFAATAAMITGTSVRVIGLGCGGGQKEAGLLHALQKPGRHLIYQPVDVSVAMVLTARQAALPFVSENECFPVVGDLTAITDWSTIGFSSDTSPAPRVLTFFGMLPNLEPSLAFPRLGQLTRPGDLLLVSANLAPGNDYAAGVRTILPQYDNALTRDWLLTFLLDLGFDRADGEVKFSIEPAPGDATLRRVTACFQVVRKCRIDLGDDRFEFSSGDNIRLFYSYRYTPDRVAGCLAHQGLTVLDQWITPSGEEGVFLANRISAAPAVAKNQ